MNGSNYGSIKIDSNPSGADVIIDEKNYGKTPLDITDVIEKKYNYTVSKQGFKSIEGSLDVFNNNITILNINFLINKQSINIEKKNDFQIFAEQLPPTQSMVTKDIPKKTSEKSVYYNTGDVSIATASSSPPGNTDGYPSVQNVYANNYQTPIDLMTLMNHGPGNLFYILRDKLDKFSTTEEILHVGESRTLYNVYEIRLRTDIPNTIYHLVEGEIKGGSFSRNFKNFVENRIVLQPNEFESSFEILFDTDLNPVPGTALPTNNALFIRQNPLAAGASAVFYNTGINPFTPTTPNPFPATPALMPFLIITGYIAEGFSFLGMMSTNFTIRNWLELIPTSSVYTLLQTWTFPARSSTFISNNLNVISTANLDTTGAPAPGRNFILTITNNDTVNTMTGWFAVEIVLRRLS